MEKQFTILQPTAEIVNPHIWTDSRASLSIRFALFEALIRQDQAGKYLPSLATSWQVEDDACTWTFQIRQDVQFHDGSLLTVDDVVATLAHAASPSIPGAYGTDALLYSYLGQAKFQIINHQTVQISTSEPMADLLDLLVNIVIVPARTLTDTGISECVGSGPFQLGSTKPDCVVMNRFENYWGNQPAVQRITWKGEADPGRRVESILNGEVDFITYIPPAFEEKINLSGAASYINLQIHLCVILMINLNSTKCRDVRVRQALNYAVDVDGLIADVMGGRAARLNGPLSPLHGGYNPSIEPYPYDPERARSLLVEAGYPDGIELAFDLPTSSPNESLLLAEHLITQYKRAGITLKPSIHTDRPAYAYRVKNKQFDDFCIFDSSPTSSYRVLREKIHSGIAGPWWAGYTNHDVDRMMERAWGITDEKERNLVYQQISALVYKEAAWVFLYNPTDGMAVRKGVQGWTVGMGGLLQFN